MSLVRCCACGRRSVAGDLAEVAACPWCRGRELEPAMVSEEATVAAVTTLRVGVPDDGVRHLVVARLSDLSVFASADEPLALDSTVLATDREDGGFQVTRLPGAAS